MLHKLRLHDAPFRNIKKGIKNVEARLFDEKRQQIQPWDTIIFINRKHPEQKIHTTVIELFHYPSFNAMFKELHEKYRPRSSREELEDSMLQYYSTEEEKKYGVIGIKIQPFSPQEETLATYNENIDAYMANTISTPSEILKYWIKRSLQWVPHTGTILEVGTWGGRDADYIESLWFNILRSDGATGFVEYHRNMGKNVLLYNVLTDELHDEYDLIFANAVLLHFPHSEVEHILKKWKQHLTPTGKISRCVQEWVGEQLKENKNMKRYFYFRSEAEVKEVMKNLWYKNLDVWVDEPEPGKRWIRCIATL